MEDFKSSAQGRIYLAAVDVLMHVGDLPEEGVFAFMAFAPTIYTGHFL